MVAIIDYEAGNIFSVRNALDRLGCENVLTADPDTIMAADKVILPGVGDAAVAMESLRKLSIDGVIRGLRQPVLGICVGMQVLCLGSEESDVEGLGIFRCCVKRLGGEADVKVPHVGWNTVESPGSGLLKGVKDGEYVYYVHSYAPEICMDTIASTEYGRRFSAALNCRNFYGTQFHPEKSGRTGERILKNFLEL